MPNTIRLVFCLVLLLAVSRSYSQTFRVTPDTASCGVSTQLKIEGHGVDFRYSHGIRRAFVTLSVPGKGDYPSDSATIQDDSTAYVLYLLPTGVTGDRCDVNLKRDPKWVGPGQYDYTDAYSYTASAAISLIGGRAPIDTIRPNFVSPGDTADFYVEGNNCWFGLYPFLLDSNTVCYLVHNGDTAAKVYVHPQGNHGILVSIPLPTGLAMGNYDVVLHNRRVWWYDYEGKTLLHVAGLTIVPDSGRAGTSFPVTLIANNIPDTVGKQRVIISSNKQYAVASNDRVPDTINSFDSSQSIRVVVGLSKLAPNGNFDLAMTSSSPNYTVHAPFNVTSRAWLTFGVLDSAGIGDTVTLKIVSHNAHVTPVGTDSAHIFFWQWGDIDPLSVIVADDSELLVRFVIHVGQGTYSLNLIEPGTRAQIVSDSQFLIGGAPEVSGIQPSWVKPNTSFVASVSLRNIRELSNPLVRLAGSRDTILGQTISTIPLTVSFLLPPSDSGFYNLLLSDPNVPTVLVLYNCLVISTYYVWDGVDAKTNPQSPIILLPNPAANYVYLPSNDESMMIYDDLGQSYTCPITREANRSRINTSMLPAGHYFIVAGKDRGNFIIAR